MYKCSIFLGPQTRHINELGGTLLGRLFVPTSCSLSQSYFLLTLIPTSWFLRINTQPPCGINARRMRRADCHTSLRSSSPPSVGFKLQGLLQHMRCDMVFETAERMSMKPMSRQRPEMPQTVRLLASRAQLTCNCQTQEASEIWIGHTTDVAWQDPPPWTDASSAVVGPLFEDDAWINVSRSLSTPVNPPS